MGFNSIMSNSSSTIDFVTFDSYKDSTIQDINEKLIELSDVMEEAIKEVKEEDHKARVKEAKRLYRAALKKRAQLDEQALKEEDECEAEQNFFALTSDWVE